MAGVVGALPAVIDGLGNGDGAGVGKLAGAEDVVDWELTVPAVGVGEVRTIGARVGFEVGWGVAAGAGEGTMVWTAGVVGCVVLAAMGAEAGWAGWEAIAGGGTAIERGDGGTATGVDWLGFATSGRSTQVLALPLPVISGVFNGSRETCLGIRIVFGANSKTNRATSG